MPSTQANDLLHLIFIYDTSKLEKANDFYNYILGTFSWKVYYVVID